MLESGNPIPWERSMECSIYTCTAKKCLPIAKTSFAVYTEHSIIYSQRMTVNCELVYSPSQQRLLNSSHIATAREGSLPLLYIALYKTLQRDSCHMTWLIKIYSPSQQKHSVHNRNWENEHLLV